MNDEKNKDSVNYSKPPEDLLKLVGNHSQNSSVENPSVEENIKVVPEKDLSKATIGLTPIPKQEEIKKMQMDELLKKTSSPKVELEIKTRKQNKLFLFVSILSGTVFVLVLLFAVFSKTDTFKFSGSSVYYQNKTLENLGQYQTAVVTDNIYDGVTVNNSNDAKGLITKDSNNQKLKCDKEDVKNIETSIEENYGIVAVNLCEIDYEFAKEIETVKVQGKDTIPGIMVFRLYDTYGFPPEVTEELAQENGMKIDKEEFEKLFKEHQEKSRAGSEQKFKGGLASTGEKETKYHTATHLLSAALKVVLGTHVHQRGSNITAERMRFDFSHPVKMTDEEKQKTEELVNEWIKEGIPVEHVEMKKDEAIRLGAEAMFIEKYGDVVSVYKIGDKSLELCGGPHVQNTSELGHFKIKKEESSSSGVRRIKAVLE